jgi:hypothetical protein
MRHLIAGSLLLWSITALAQPRPPPAPEAARAPAPPAAPLPPTPFGLRTPGIPPQIAQKLGLSSDTVKKVRDYGFEANEAVIGLEADLKRAQLDLEKALAQNTGDDAAVLGKLETVGRAELAVRKNRFALMLRIRKLLGPDTWERLQAEMQVSPEAGGPGMLMLAPGVQRREVRVINRSDGTTNVSEINE